MPERMTPEMEREIREYPELYGVTGIAKELLAELDAAREKLAATEAERDLLAGLLEEAEGSFDSYLPDGSRIWSVDKSGKQKWLITSHAHDSSFHSTALEAIRASMAQKQETPDATGRHQPAGCGSVRVPNRHATW